MNRRDFLTVVSGASALAVCGGVGGLWVPSWRAEAAGVRIAPRRQGVTYPVQVRLDLSHMGSDGVPHLVAFREGAPDWVEPATLEDVRSEGLGRALSARWLPPIVRPTAAEMEAELIRFRLVALDDSGRALGCSNALEVVCGRRGWGC